MAATRISSSSLRSCFGLQPFSSSTTKPVLRKRMSIIADGSRWRCRLRTAHTSLVGLVTEATYSPTSCGPHTVSPSSACAATTPAAPRPHDAQTQVAGLCTRPGAQRPASRSLDVQAAPLDAAARLRVLRPGRSGLRHGGMGCCAVVCAMQRRCRRRATLGRGFHPAVDGAVCGRLHHRTRCHARAGGAAPPPPERRCRATCRAALCAVRLRRAARRARRAPPRTCIGAGASRHCPSRLSSGATTDELNHRSFDAHLRRTRIGTTARTTRQRRGS